MAPFVQSAMMETRMRRTARVAFLVLAVVVRRSPPPLAAQAPRSVFTLEVDATEAPRGILHAARASSARRAPHARLSEVDPGRARPTGPITDLVGLKITADGKPVPWRRDDVDMFAFRCEVPAGDASTSRSTSCSRPRPRDSREARRRRRSSR